MHTTMQDGELASALAEGEKTSMNMQSKLDPIFNSDGRMHSTDRAFYA